MVRRCLRGFSPYDVQHRRNAILYIKIRFSLLAVSKHTELLCILEYLAIEIENMSVGIAFTQNRDESKDVAFEAEPFAIGLDEPFAGQLGGRI